MDRKPDYTWQVTAVNVFLLIVVLSSIDGFSRHYFILEIKAPIQTMAGIVVVYLLVSAVLTSIFYLCSRNKHSFRVKRCLITNAWIAAALQCYGIARADDSIEFAKAFVQSAYQSCYQTQRASTNNSGVPEKFIKDYCYCTSNHLYNSFTPSELVRLDHLLKNGTPPPADVQSKINSSGKACTKASIEKMSPSELELLDRLIAGQKR